MSLKTRFLHGGLVLSAGYAIQQAVLFVRNVMIARLVGPEDFGIVVTFLILIYALEMASDLGVELYLIRAPNGDKPIVQSTLHTVLVVRGIVLGLIVLLAADLTAWFFNTPEAAWAYRSLAVVPVIKGFLHLDVRRLQRQLVYFPTVNVLLSGTLASTAVAITLAYFWRSYEAMVWAYIAEPVAMVLASHIFAKRDYRFDTAKVELRSLLKYGWPLMLNGLALFLMSQGDRAIIGSRLGVTDLANYAVAALLTAGPTALIIKVSGALFLPLLSSDDSSSSTFARRYDWCGALTALSAFPVVILLAFYGAPLADILYGEKYDISVFVMAWLAAGAGARILRSWPQAAALAVGSTGDVLIANALPTLGFLAAVLSLQFNFGAVGVAVSITLGEIIALFFALERSDRQAIEGRREGRKLGILFLLLAASCIAAITLFQPGWTSMPLFFSALILLSLAFGGVLLVSNSIRSWLVRAVRILRGGGIKTIL